MFTVQQKRKNILNTFTYHDNIRNVDRAMLNTVFENTVRRVNICLENGGGHFEHSWFKIFAVFWNLYFFGGISPASD
jgi:hypothetical protein